MKPRAHIASLLVILVWTTYFVALKLNQLDQLQAGAELAEIEDVFWNFLHGHGLTYDAGDHFFARHFSPILYPLALVYALAPWAKTMAVLQALLVSSGAVPLHFLARKLLSVRWASPMVLIVYFTSRYTSYGLLYDFHMESLFPAAVFLAVLGLVTQRTLLLVLGAILLLSVKENGAIALLGIALLSLSWGRTRLGLTLATLSVAWIGAALAVIIPSFRPTMASSYEYLDYWREYGSKGSEIARNMLNPVRQLQVLTRPERLGKAFNLFGSFAFMPLTDWRAVLLALPVLALLFTSSNPLLYGQAVYYGFLPVALLLAGSLLAVATLSRRFTNRSRAQAVLLGLIVLVSIGNSRLFRELQPGYWQPNPRRQSLRSLTSLVPGDASVGAQVKLMSQLSASQNRRLLPGSLGEVEYALFDTQGDSWPVTPARIEAIVDSLRTDPDWEVVGAKTGFSLFRRATALPRNGVRPSGTEEAPAADPVSGEASP